MESTGEGPTWIENVGFFLSFPLDNWSTEDVTDVVCKFGRLLACENDANHKGRIMAKIRCTHLQEIPKSIRDCEKSMLNLNPGHFPLKFFSGLFWEVGHGMRIHSMMRVSTHMLLPRVISITSLLFGLKLW
jgi:hypothetical protein